MCGERGPDGIYVKISKVMKGFSTFEFSSFPLIFFNKKKNTLDAGDWYCTKNHEPNSKICSKNTHKIGNLLEMFSLFKFYW